MDLPPELRNRIHEYTVRYTDYEYTMRYECSPASPRHEVLARGAAIDLTWRLSRGYPAWQPAITKVSRQLRQETLAMFYATNRFVLDLGANMWLRAIGPVNAAHIKDFTIRYNPRTMPKPIEKVMAESGISLVAGVAKLEAR
ncbi:hypothetical protein LTR27_009142 [Elasticomyces elasticus]|nr:hypothetical protein LTR27_009142 [Elasticomyces elasticus]